MAPTVGYSVDSGIATLRLEREHGNAINAVLVEELVTACREAERDDRVHGLLLAASGRLFCPGLDLIELSRYDRQALAKFIRRFGACILSLYTVSKPLVAAIHGHALAGGCVLSLTADWRVLVEGAKVGLNEVRIGVPLPFGVTMILRESVTKAHLEEVALFGRNYSGDSAVEAGLVHEVVASDRFEQVCRERVEELAAKEPRAFAITKRYLRSPAVERIRANDAQAVDEFVETWFSPQTQQRILAVLEQLGGRDAD